MKTPAPASPAPARGVCGVRGARGFTLIETMIALVLLLFALALAAQLLAESAQRFATAQGEVSEPPAVLLLARMRGDVRAAASFSLLPDGGLRLDGHPAGTVVYRQVGSDLRRQVVAASGEIESDAPAWRNVVAFSAVPLGDRLAAITITYRRRALGRSPLQGLPADRGSVWEERTETLQAVPRGGGLGSGW